MNAAIRAVVRTRSDRGWQVCGVRQGYAGLIAGNVVWLGPREVGGIIQRGGTMLGSARCQRFEDAAGREQAIVQRRHHDIDALVVIGGDGSQSGAFALSQAGLPVVGVASTIDNDLYGSDSLINGI
jgi:6-phosphofructokinase 1